MRCYITFGPLFLFVIAGATVAATSDGAAIRGLHAKVLTPSSDALFAAESTAPTTDSDWNTLQKHADALAKAAKTLSALRQAKSEKQWRKLAADLRGGADAAADAAKSHNLGKLTDANGAIVAACEGCHDVYRDGGRGMTSDKTANP